MKKTAFSLLLLFGAGLFFLQWREGERADPVSLSADRQAEAAAVQPELERSAAQAVSGPEVTDRGAEPAAESGVGAGQDAGAAGETAAEAGERLGAAEGRLRVFEAIDNRRLAEQLTPERRRFWEELRVSFPGVDLTEVQEFHGMISAKRETFGFELTDETRPLFRDWMAAADALHREMVNLRAAAHGLSPGGMEDGRGYALIGFEEGRPSYTFTANVGAAISTGANLLRWSETFDPALGPTVDGSGLYVNVNDYEEIVEHNEFQLPGGGSRIMVAETPWYSASGDHMTHVAGTVGAWGYDDRLLGMAPRVWIRSLIQQTTSHISTFGMSFPGEMHNVVNPRTGEMQMKSVMGTTSLGSLESDLRYTSRSRSFDIVLRDHPYYVHFYAAGNNGSGFGTISNNEQLAKNVITIGAANNVSRDEDGTFLSGGGIAGFSSRGPTFDGRIKPDFVANGVGLRSTSGTSGSSSKNGTSMATPNASGSTVLLIDYVQQRFPGHFFRSSTYKALLMNTADDRGNPGPDFTFGWGMINVYAAGQLIRRHAENPYERVLREERLQPGQTWTYTYHSDGVSPIRVSLAWLDVAGPSQTSTSTDRSPRLVNDLDMRIVGPDGTVHEPFVMPFVTGQGGTPAFDPSLHNANATTGDNFTDPAEQILIAAPDAGTYTIQITHKGTLSGGQPQPFSLAVSGLRSAAVAPAVVSSVSPNEGNNTNNFAMSVLGGGFVPGSDVLLRRDGSPVVTAYRVIPVGDRIDFRVDTSGIDKGFYDVVVRAPDGTESVLPNGFLMPAEGGGSGRVTLYSNTFENADGLTLTGNWAVGVPNQSSVSGPGNAFSGTQVLGTYLNGNYENNINIFATLPPFSTVNRTDIRLEFRRWLGVAFNQSGNPNNRHRDDARIHYSLNGSTWTQLWESNGAFNENSWTQQTLNLPAAVNNQAQVYLRFQLQTDGSNVSYGWNIDDLRVTGEAAGGLLLPPVFTSLPETMATQDEIFEYFVTTSDADTPGEELTLSAGTLPAGLTFTDNGDGTGLLSGTPTVSGSFEIRLSVTDGAYTTWQEFDLLILPVGGNTAPEILTTSIPAANEAQAYAAWIEAEDAEGHALSFSVGLLPNWLNFTDNGNGTATLSGTPNTVGTFNIAVSVTDGFETVQRTFSLLVNPRPRVGFVLTSVDVEEDAGTVTVEVTRTLNAAGEVSVQYATQNGEAVAGTDFAAVSGTLSWGDGELGTRTITVTIFDDDFTQGDRDFTVRLSNLSPIATMGNTVLTVNILDNNENTAPEITMVSPVGARVAIPPGMGLRVSGTVSDDGLPAWGTFTQGWTVEDQPEDSSVSFTNAAELTTGITFSHEGVYTLVFTADDGEFSDSVSLRVQVTDEVTGGLPQENLALWLPLDENSGSIAADESGNGRDASLTGEPVWQPGGGAIGGALQFTAAGQRGNVANSAGLNNTSRMSWAFWLNPAGNITGDQGVLGKRTSTNNANKDWGFWFRANAGNRLTFDIGSTRTEASASIPANTWTHVAFVFDGTLDQAERMRMYVNGEFTQALAVGSTTIQNNNVNVALASFQLDDNRNFIGRMDEVVIYHGRALSSEEVLQVMQGGLGGNLGPLVVIGPVAGVQAQEPVQLSASVTDDGLPEDPGTVTLKWEQVEGPGSVSFDNPAVAAPLATFPVAGSYVLRLNANDGAVTTFADLAVTVEAGGPFAPLILTQPQSQTVVAGEAVTLSVAAIGNPEPEFQWYFEGDPLAGAVSDTLTIAAMGPEHAGSYVVRVRNDLDHIDSQAAVLTLLPPPSAPASLSATALSNRIIALSWSDTSEPPGVAESFVIEVSAEGSHWELLAQVAATEHLHSGLAPLTTRFYRVRSLNAAGSSAWSATVSATTLEGEPEELLLYEFTHEAEGIHPTLSAEGLVSGPAANGGGLNRFRTDEGGAVDMLSVVNDSARTDVEEAFANNEFFTITLAPEAGYTLSLETLNFKVTRGGSSGERNFAVRSSLQPGVNLLGPQQPEAVRGSWDVESVSLSGPEFQGLTEPVTFTFIVATGSTSISLEFDDIRFVGMVTSAGQGNETFTVTFVDYDGTVLKTETVEAGQAATAPADPVRTGHTFTGWDVPFDNIIGDLTVTAQYQINQYTLTFDSAGGSAVAPITQAFGTAVTAPAAPVKAGHSFAGWEPELPETMPAANVTHTAQWLPLSADATLLRVLSLTDPEPAGGNGSEPSDPVTWTLEVAHEVEFVGLEHFEAAAGASVRLYSDAAFSADEDQPIALVAETPVTAYVRITAENGSTVRYYAVILTRAAEPVFVTLSFDRNGGSGASPADQILQPGDTVTLPGPGDLSKTGHAFNGWRDILAAVTYAAGDSLLMPSADLTLAAQWTVPGGAGQYVQAFNNTVNQLVVENAGIGWQRAAHDGNVSADQVGRLSAANGPDGQAGFAYTFRANNNASLMWYEGLTLSQQTLQGFSAYVGHSHGSNRVRFLIRIGDHWYASADGGGHAPTVGDAAWFETGAVNYAVAFSPENTWVQVAGFNGTSSGTFTLLEGGNLAALASLPAGDITAVGVYLANLGGGSTRFDDFTVTWTGAGGGFGVTYAANGAEGSAPVDGNAYAEGSLVTVMGPGNLTREGLTFAGWHDGVTLLQPLDTFVMPVGDVVLTAQWSGGVELFTVTFVDYDGTVLKTETVEAGQAATAPADPVRTGYSFIGWDVPFGTITGDLTVTALYQMEAPDQDLTRYWGGGTANWTGTASWFDNPGLTGTGQLWQDGWHAVIGAGDPALNASVTAGNLHIEDGARVRVGGNNQVLTIMGETTGTGTVRFDRTNSSNTSGLRFENTSAQTVAWDFLLNNDQSRIRLEIAGSAPVTLDGTMLAWGNAFDIVQEPGSHVIIGPNARINNNRSDLINARPFHVVPADATAIFETHPDFNADLADPDVFENTYPFAKPEDDSGDGFYVKPVGGLSTWRTVSGTTITHATQNLASIHKYTGGTKRYTHHGLWNFEGTGSEPEPVWIVRTNPQSYDGGIYFVRDWTLNTEEDFTFEGLWHDGVNIGFSTRSGAQDITFTKTGPADFILRGTQAYGPGTVMRVEEGGVRFFTDPLVGEVPKAGNSWFNHTGNFLNLQVHAGAEASFVPPAGETFHLASASVTGSLFLHYTGVPTLAVSGDLTVSGVLVIQPEITLSASSYVVATVDGDIDLSQASVMVPQGWELAVVGHELRLQQAASDPFLDWLAQQDYPPGTTGESDDSRGGVTLTVREVWVAGLTPMGDDVFRITGMDAQGLPRFEPERQDRVYTTYWTNSLTDPDWMDVTEVPPPLQGPVFFRVNVRLP